MPKVFVSGRLVTHPDSLAGVLDLLAELIEHVCAHEPGTEQYVVSQNVAQPHELWLHEVYTDHDAFVAHGHHPTVRALSGQINAVLAEIQLARTLTVLAKPDSLREP